MSFPFKKRPSRILISFTENKQFLKPTIYQVQIFKKSPEFVPRGQEADDRQNNCFNNFNGLYTKYLSPFRMELFRKSYVTISKIVLFLSHPQIKHEQAVNLNFKTKFGNERFTFLNFEKRGGIAVNKRWCFTYC